VRRRLEISRQHPLKERHEPPQFGYRGFVIFDEAREAGLPYRTDIFGGFVAIVEERPEAPPHAPRQPLFTGTQASLRTGCWNGPPSTD
jgi:hypothetical protein